MTQLAGKVAIVTGAGRGLGRAVAVRLASDGARLLLVDIDPVTVADAASEVVRLGGTAKATTTAQAVTADVKDESACNQVVEAALDAFGAADILVNVANYPVPPGRAEEIDLAHWHRSFAAGPLAMFMLARAVFPHMKAAGGGRIVNFGSELSENPRPERAIYAASKGAVRSLTKALARRLDHVVSAGAHEKARTQPARRSHSAPRVVARLWQWPERGSTKSV